ncbi:MAG TPA: hypothetical protein VGC65_03695 [Bacteroidia bacterium]
MIVLKGDATEKEWATLFEEIKTQRSVKEIVFTGNLFESLPTLTDNLFSIESLSFLDNENLNYNLVLPQLSELPNLQNLTLGIFTIFDLPNNLYALKNIQNVVLINTDESISKNESAQSEAKEPIAYDYYINKGDKKFASLKYIALAGEIDSAEYKELSKRFETTINFSRSNAGFISKYANVIPPIKGIDVERTNYKINPGIENIVTYPSGTKILIPANAFIDKNGQPVTTSVTLSYREFRDPVDFLVSGIPMKYDTAGEVTNFESAGMFEMTASTLNEPVALAADKNIDMNFASTSKDSTYNFYAFNDSTGNWEYLNKPKAVTSQTTIKLKAPTQAYRAYQNFAMNNQRIYDSTVFAKRFDDTSYVYTSIKTKGNKRISYRSEGKKREKSVYSLVRINSIKKTKEGTVLFKVNYLNTAHPEMREFNDVYFALNENMSPSEFKQKFGRRKYYNDVRVYTSGGDLEIKLKDNKSVKSLSASLVTVDQKGEPKEVRNVSTRMKRYSRTLGIREKRFNKALLKGRNSDNDIYVTDPKQLSLYAFAKAKKLMNADEKKMSYTEWLDYCKQTQENEKKWHEQTNAKKLADLNTEEANASNLTQSLSLSGLGIYNCDQIQRMKQPVEIFANYKTTGNKSINPKSAYVIDKTSNSVFQYDGYRGYSASKIAFSKSDVAQNTLLAVNDDGSLAVYKTEEFKKTVFKNKSHFDFVVTKIDAEFTTVEELRKLIGF